MTPTVEDDDARHRREEKERRAKRKAAKASKVKSSEKDRKRREHAERVLQQQQGKHKKARTEQPGESAIFDDSSKFEALFAQRSQGFQMEFAFRNAPPRPPVGPCFVGLGLDGQLQESSLYHPTVELNYTWKLHSEPDLGVPLAPSAMDSKLYKQGQAPSLIHPDDDALLNWTGSLGDTAAECLKVARDQARAAARLALQGKALPNTATPTMASSGIKKKKEFSRVLDESMQSWMKKTTYLSNDYSRKVHDFTSLAKTKQKTAESLEAQQAEIMETHRTTHSIEKTFDENKIAVGAHPSKPHLKPVSYMPLLPNVEHWGHAYTHVVLDNPPKGEDETNLDLLKEAFCAHVEKRPSTQKLTCQLLVPAKEKDEYRPMQSYDLDVIPLKEDEAPHVHFAIWMGDDTNEATYLPIASRVQLSTGRPVKKREVTVISRRAPSQQEERILLERTAEVDADVAKQLESRGDADAVGNDAPTPNTDAPSENKGATAASSYNPMQVEDSSDEEQDGTFVASKAIAAEG